MDLADLKRRAEGARRFSFKRDGDPVTLEMRIPTFPQMQLIVARSGDGTRGVLIQPGLMREAVVGWSGVKESDISPGASDEPLEFDPSLMDFVFDKWPSLYNDAYMDLMRREAERRKLTEDAKGNSSSASTGNATGTPIHPSAPLA